MRHRPRIVVDTNCLVSRLLLADSTPGRAVHKAVESGLLLVSDSTMQELAEVLSRPKFDPYISLEDRLKFIRMLGRVSELVRTPFPVGECDDPNDDKFLEVALNGRAEFIVTGDDDLLRMHPWRKIAILSPAAYLREPDKP